VIDLSIIIVNYNVKDLLGNCIDSIFSSSGQLKTEIIIVDNNSFDGSVEYIKERFRNNRQIRIIESKINLGFAKANNIGAREAKGKYLLILNPDTILQEDTIVRSVKYYESNDHIGALSCKLVLPNGKLDLACRRSFPSPSVAIYRILGLSKLFPASKTFARYNLTYLDENATHEVEAICGAFMLIKKDIFDQVGGFDEDYFMYGEDLDLCYKIKKAGYKIIYFSGTSIIHFKGESTRKSSLSYVNNFYGAMRIFVQKNLHKNSIILNSLIKLLIIYRASISYLARLLRISYPAIIDITLIVIAMLISIKMRFEFFPIEAYELPIIIYSIVWLLSLSLTGNYKRSNVLSLIKPLNGILIGFFINSSLTYFFNEYAFSRVVILRSTAYSYIFLAGWRVLLKMINYARQKNIFSSIGNTIIIGKNRESEGFLNKLKKRIEADYNILGFISTENNSEGGYIGNLDNLKDVIVSSKVKNVIFAKSVLSNQKILDLMWNLKNYNLSYKILSSDSDIILGKSPLDKIDEIYLMQIEYNINKKFNIFVKRIFDLILGINCLIFVYPFIYLYLKFLNAKPESHKFLKKVLLIPEVVKGKLSFVGRATWDSTSEGKQFLGKNGLTGLVQINYYKILTADECEYYNYYYAKNQTLTLDLEIILKTISLFLFSKKVVKL
jgi:O-antigen biosynthesis protein